MSVIFDLLYFTLIALAAFGTLRAMRWLLSVLPWMRPWVGSVERLWPGVTAAVTLGLIAHALRSAFSDSPERFPVMGVALIAALLLLIWNPARDMATGVLLKGLGAFPLGTLVRMDGLEGRVAHLGLRAITLTTVDGEEAVVPFSKVASASVVRSLSKSHTSPHMFRVHLPAGMTVAHARRQIRKVALLQHWSSVARDPEVKLIDRDWLEVTAFTLDADHVPRIEQAIRRGLLEEGAVPFKSNKE
ncbi:MAG: mechanosensitive ion channel domain-containing protein [Myxococcota bacterium]